MASRYYFFDKTIGNVAFDLPYSDFKNIDHQYFQMCTAFDYSD